MIVTFFECRIIYTALADREEEKPAAIVVLLFKFVNCQFLPFCSDQ